MEMVYVYQVGSSESSKRAVLGPKRQMESKGIFSLFLGLGACFDGYLFVVRMSRLGI
jgi:hypothetical protein